MRTLKMFVVVLFGFMFFVPAAALTAKDEWAKNLEKQVQSDIQLTKMGLSGSVATEGAIFKLKVRNIQGVPSSLYVDIINIVENGKKTGDNGLAGMQIPKDTEVGILKIVLGKQDVKVRFITLNQISIMTEGTQLNQFMYAWLKFPVPNLETLDAAAVEQIIYGALVPDTQTAQN
jgi:hypothetical protein